MHEDYEYRSQFDLRDIFWVVLVAAVVCGWMYDSQTMRTKAIELQKELYDSQAHLKFLQDRYNDYSSYQGK